MSSNQIFQTDNKKRWLTVKWTSRVIIFIAVFVLSVVAITIINAVNPSLPQIKDKASVFSNKLNPNNKFTLASKENKKYFGFEKFLMKKIEEDSVKKLRTKIVNAKTIRSAFYVTWDKASLMDLRRNAGKLNTIYPEWFFIDPVTYRIQTRIDTAGLAVMRKHKLSIQPIFSNFLTSKDPTKRGDFSGQLLHKLLTDATVRKTIIDDIIRVLTKYKFQGINVDFEELIESKNENLTNFQKELYQKLHERGFIVSMDVLPNNQDFDYKALGKSNDYVILMAYDQYSDANKPGPISSQKWIEEQIDIMDDNIPASKIILGVAGYGRDWYTDGEGNKFVKDITFSNAIDDAKLSKAKIKYDNDTFNLNYVYSENNSQETFNHSVWFTDAATTFNILRFADDYSTAGTVLWRLGGEDPRIWHYYGRDLSAQSLRKYPFNFSSLSSIPYDPNVKPTHVGEGELLDVLYSPQKGKIKLEIDKKEMLISEQNYETLPSGFIYEKFAEDETPIGPGHKIILTFDDGPNPEFTPKILDILEKENVPATFFVVGINAQQNIPLLQRIYRDGYEIGNHTYTHNNVAKMSYERADLELKTTRSLIECVTGRSTVLFRAPYNADSEPQTYDEIEPIARAKLDNYISVGESIDPNDWNPKHNADIILAETIKLANSTNASIILLHDSGGYSRQPTVDALPKIIAYFKKRGCKFTTVADLMGKTKDDLMPKIQLSWQNRMNFIFAEVSYWLNKTIFLLFIIGIILSISRMVIIMIIAYIRKLSENEEESLIDDGAVRVKPFVSIIVPAYNEEVNCLRTIKSLLNQDYPNIEIVFIDDGSKDDTYKRVYDEYKDNPKIKIFTKPNGGKATALNFGIEKSSHDFLVCIDADTQLKSDAVSFLMDKFYVRDAEKHKILDPKIGAIAGNVKVGNEVNMISRWQSIEYITSQNFDRRAFDYLECITVVPGAIGAFRKDAVLIAGGFTTDTLAEDCDLTMRLHGKGYLIRNCTSAISYTEVPETMSQFLKQRFRWSFGIIQSFWKHRKALFRRKHKNFGLIALPNILIFQIILPFLSPLADLILIISLLFASVGIIPASFDKIILYYLIFMLVDIIGAAVAFYFEKEDYRKLIWLIPQKLIYRQLMYYILLKSFRKAIKGELQGWGILNRTGNVQELEK
ncbi:MULTISPECIES: polysaccharide deacetylase family protein [unclassified Flavobacterium]|jgi:cellulose synthase/poly-beta-1,6-N-acetylglucosamine synthase-like glycosyltransferase/spore germination protein YaaH/peptidoglycan/xylan/chitin deacetylase (PgdA/CDA1 family)|uniref:polysaccharide deacetylase family protein n=1 Tax=unclassified Flavobacterium TaxID=196869 RepID=UPI0025C716D0|nr:MULTISPECIES: polysaccharide deacetylase family protein [unclassified Flavobacterium]